MKKYNEIIKSLSKLKTEQVNANTIDIDRLAPLDIVTKINAEDKSVALAVEKKLKEIAQAAEMYASTLKNGGRVFYIGAGTSGRLGVLDAAECPPTFGTDPKQIIGLISGGYDTLILSQEGVEDQVEAGVADLDRQKLNKNDLVIGIAASKRTPYTLSGLKKAKMTGCRTIFIVCNRWENEPDNQFDIDIIIDLEVGPEVITGSTRMKSGTAQKMTLNLISTTAMILTGKTFGNLMVDLQARSEKLAGRSRKILMDIFEMTLEEADQLMGHAQGSVKTAIVMKKFGISYDEAMEALKQNEGFISRININK